MSGHLLTHHQKTLEILEISENNNLLKAPSTEDTSTNQSDYETAADVAPGETVANKPSMLTSNTVDLLDDVQDEVADDDAEQTESIVEDATDVSASGLLNTIFTSVQAFFELTTPSRSIYIQT